ncbi:MAG: cation diffusion facilitator family transporter [Bacillota bacterium]
MQKFTNSILRIFVEDYRRIDLPEVRKKYGSLGGWVSIVLNVILFAIKLFFGLLINSVSLIADAVHTLADVITSAIVVVSFKISSLPKDKEHPFGHGRAEEIATLIIAVLLVVVGFEFLHQSINRFFSPQDVEYNLLVLVVMLVAAAIKEWMYHFSKDLGNRIESQALIADAWHHRTDAFASLVVGIGLLGVLVGYPKVDALLGVVVSGLIIYTGYEIGRDVVNHLLGVRPSEELVEAINKCAMTVDGVQGLHNIELHEYGEIKHLTAHMEVCRLLDITEAHQISDVVEKKINETLGVKILIHIEPWEDCIHKEINN